MSVLTGALMVGDSVRASLRSLAQDRIGQTRFALTSDTFFREQLSPEAPLIALEAVVTHDSSGRRASRVALYGIDQRFFDFHQKAAQAPEGSDFLLSQPLAEELGSQAGDSLLVRVPRMSAIPTESLHGRREDPGRTIRGSMHTVLSRQAMGEFSLAPQQTPVRAIFISLDRLQRDLDLDGRVNLALSRDPKLQESVRRNFQLADIGLRLKPLEGHSIVEHESMLLNDPLVHAVQKAAPQAQSVLTYLANATRIGDREMPYSLIAGMDRPELTTDTDISLNDWAAEDLKAKVGDPVEISYFIWDPSGRLETKTAKFTVAAIVAVDPTTRELAPTYPGISDAESVSDWDPPFPMELGKIRKIDEDYWDRYKATPKAFIRLTAAQQLWRSRHGQVTSMRVDGPLALDRLRSAVDPFAGGLAVQDVASQMQQASTGATDFGEYFLYFSFFLIVSALLLAGLFFRLGIEQRSIEITTLRSMGFSVRQVRSLHLREALLIGVIGSLVGVLGSLLYAGLIVKGLGTWWIDAVGTRDLNLHWSPTLAFVGLTAGLLMSVLAVYASLRSLGRSPREKKRHFRLQPYASYAALAAAIALLFVGGAPGFFGAGALLLVAALGLFAYRLRTSTA
ncbi:MAG TPA: FtsX-like permease family protein, partial [Bryobacteraceae bacterium]|nr:FtsX-like permease family protein [Bryobacteraceae bacterium]